MQEFFGYACPIVIGCMILYILACAIADAIQNNYFPTGKQIVRIFNAFQIVLVLVLAPFGIQWLSAAEFKGSGVAFIAACILYFVACCFNVAAVAQAMKNWDKW